jgi:hypothetical protein
MGTSWLQDKSNYGQNKVGLSISELGSGNKTMARRGRLAGFISFIRAPREALSPQEVLKEQLEVSA